MPRKVTISGGPFERGRQYGEQAGALIRKGVEFYVDMWEKGSGRTRGELVEIISGFAGKIGDFDAEILTEIEGIAAGSGLAVDDVLIVNGRYEIMLSTLFAGGPAGGGECTSLGVARAGGSGHTLVGQNWDWAVPVGEVSILLEVLQEDRPDILTHVEAGFVGHKGINSEGLALCANAMGSQLDRFEAAVPVWVLARAALNCSSHRRGAPRPGAGRTGRLGQLHHGPTGCPGLRRGKGRLAGGEPVRRRRGSRVPGGAGVALQRLCRFQ